MNKKGMTITEVIISIALISIILIFMLNLLITIKRQVSNNQNKSSIIINNNVIINAIEKDFIDFKLKELSTCGNDNQGYLNSSNNIIEKKYCLKFTYYDTLEVGYLISYSYSYNNNNDKNVIGYKRGDNYVVREYNAIINSNNIGTVSNACTNNNCSIKITLPLFDNNLNNYSLKINYLYSNINNVTINSNFDVNDHFILQ